ncbi:MAG: chromosome segregation protein SMC [Nitrospira sp.]|nr:chromosome segregation protein SMC [Nitrospira sp.]
MKLKSLLVSGFKSFPEARLDFPQGITAVVGPNGVGKSNVVDAILWVLGEQSTKALRSERMEDVIFNGTESRKPLSMAEVSLVVSDVTNQELESLAGVMEALPGNKELMVTRRLYRDGESEYSINKIPCRLKDIRGLFLEARAGTKGHTVIEQGNIDQILSGSPQDRRTFIEEAAGIGRFKKQKTEALNKLKTTNQNLTRVRDIIAEVEKQLRTLKRQAQQAEHYRKLKEEARAIEILLLKHDFEDLHHQRTHVESELARLESREAELLAEEARLMASYEEAKSALLRDGEFVGHMQDELRQLEQGIGQALTTMEVERNRADLFDQQRTQALEEQTRLVTVIEQAATSIESIKEQVQRSEGDMVEVTGQLKELEMEEQQQGERRMSLQTRTEQSRQRLFDLAVERSQTEAQLSNFDAKQGELASRLQDIQDDQTHCRQERERAESTLAGQNVLLQQVTQHLAVDREKHETLSVATLELEGRLREVDEQRIEEQTNRAAAESRLRALEAVLQEELGYRQDQEGNDPSLRRVCQGVKEVFAERLTVPQEYEVAIEAALGEHIRAWVVHGVDDVLQALEFVTEHGWGRGTFVTAQPLVSSAGPSFSSWPALEKVPGVLGRAVDLISVPEDLQGVLQCLLSRVVLVDTLEHGLSAIQHVSQSDLGFLLLVTRTGEVIDPRGIVTGGSTGEASGLLQRRREVHSLEQGLSSMSQRIAGFDGQRRTVQEQFETNKQQLHTLDASLKESEMKQLVVEQERSVLASRLQEMEQRLNANQTELDSCQEELTRIRENERLAQTRLEEIGKQHGEEEQRLAELTTQLQGLDEAIRVLYDRLTETRLTLTTYRERHERARADLDRLQEEDRSRRARLQSLAEQSESLQVQAGQSQQERRRADAAFQELDARKTSLQGELREVEERHTSGLARTREYEQGLNESRKQCASTRDTRRDSDVHLAEIRTRMQTIEEALTGTYGEPVETSGAGLPQTDVSQGAEGEGPETWKERLQIIRTRMDRMGALNLAAIDEHRELEERYRFLHEQEEDLSESIRSLQEIIERLNRTTNRMFQQTFEAIQEKFGEVFSAFFAGGQAELVLVQPDTEDEEEKLGLDPGVDIIAQPPGKRLRNLTMLSGGEKTLTVLALLFASFLTKPSPFCILDEVDAPLDEPNVVRFARFLPQLTPLSQFLVITHNKRTMEVADSLFGVTMEEPGVSKFVSVRIADFEKV